MIFLGRKQEIWVQKTTQGISHTETHLYFITHGRRQWATQAVASELIQSSACLTQGLVLEFFLTYHLILRKVSFFFKKKNTNSIFELNTKPKVMQNFPRVANSPQYQ